MGSGKGPATGVRPGLTLQPGEQKEEARMWPQVADDGRFSSLLPGQAPPEALVAPVQLLRKIPQNFVLDRVSGGHATDGADLLPLEFPQQRPGTKPIHTP